MAPKKDKAKTGANKAEASKATIVTTAAAGTGVAPSCLEPTAMITQGDETVSPNDHDEMPEGSIQEVPLDQNGNEIREDEEEEDGEITKPARNLKTLNQY